MDNTTLSDETNDALVNLATYACIRMFSCEWDSMFSGDQAAHISTWIDGYKAGPESMKLCSNNSEVLIFKGSRSREDAAKLSCLLEELGLEDVLIVCLSEGQDIEKLNQHGMQQHGWIRDPDYNG